jgi:hypothetical protein
VTPQTEVRIMYLTGGEQRILAAIVKEDETAFYGFPGDIVYPKPGWRSTGHIVSTHTIAEYARIERDALDAVREATS